MQSDWLTAVRFTPNYFELLQLCMVYFIVCWNNPLPSSQPFNSSLTEEICKFITLMMKMTILMIIFGEYDG